MQKTIWNDDGTNGPVLICPPPKLKNYDEMVAECAAQGKALARQMANAGIFEPLYLYARRSTETENGQLFLVKDSAPNPYGYELVTGEGLRGNVAYSDYYTWIWNRARNAPIMAYGS